MHTAKAGHGARRTSVLRVFYEDAPRNFGMNIKKTVNFFRFSSFLRFLYLKPRNEYAIIAKSMRHLVPKDVIQGLRGND